MISITINGTTHDLDVDADMPLLWALREAAGLTGTKYGCGMALCGACTVQIDGEPYKSCSITTGSVGGRNVTTIEGLDSTAGAAVKASWVDLQVPQCGFCQSGMIMAATSLLEQNPQPDDDDIDQALQNNICRCATYVRVRQAIKTAAQTLHGGGGQDD